jgi:branched-chain amino acid transport system ATP-binding protein
MRFELAKITAGYGKVQVLRDVDLVVPDGGVVALVGPNGAGKTTLLRVASNLLRPRSGQVLIDERDVTGLSSVAIARLGVCHIAEGRNIFPALSVRDNLRLFSAKGAENVGAERAIDAFPRLGERLGQTAGTLSGGEQQMLAMARAYLRRAPMVLLDEPSTGLAPILVDAMFDFLHRLAAEGSSVLLVEQYVSRALALADTAYILARGRMVFAGEPTELADTDLFAHYLGAEAR